MSKKSKLSLKSLKKKDTKASHNLRLFWIKRVHRRTLLKRYTLFGAILAWRKFVPNWCFSFPSFAPWKVEKIFRDFVKIDLDYSLRNEKRKWCSSSAQPKPLYIRRAVRYLFFSFFLSDRFIQIIWIFTEGDGIESRLSS